MSRQVKNILWRVLLAEVDEIRENPAKQETLLLPVHVWREKAEQIGRDGGAKIAMRGPMSEKQARKMERDLKNQVEALAQRLTNGWPLSDETRNAVVSFLEDAAVGATMDFLERVVPFPSRGGAHA
jgi:hypothetical protein